MKTSDFLRQHGACRDGSRWALSVSKDMADVWDELLNQGKHDWLLWTVTRNGVFPDATLRKLACVALRETPLLDGGHVWDLLTDARCRHAVEAAEAHIDGKATDADLKSAADVAAIAVFDAAVAVGNAYDAGDAAAWSAAHAALDAAVAAAGAAAFDACNAASCSVGSAAKAAACASAEDDAAKEFAAAAQTRMIAALGNPFRRSPIQTAAGAAGKA